MTRARRQFFPSTRHINGLPYQFNYWSVKKWQADETAAILRKHKMSARVIKDHFDTGVPVYIVYARRARAVKKRRARQARTAPIAQIVSPTGKVV